MTDLLVRGGWVHTAPGTEVETDLLVRDGVLVATGPDAPVLDAAGASVVPLLVQSAVDELPPGEQDAWHLVPGRPATFAVVRGRVSADRVRRMLVVAPADLVAVVVDGRVVARHGEPVRDGSVADDRLGDWTDPSRDLVQHLLPGGRYSETRQGRRDAYTGSFRIDGDRITYLDDSGFWAFGQWVAGRLHHAGFVMHRR